MGEAKLVDNVRKALHKPATLQKHTKPAKDSRAHAATTLSELNKLSDEERQMAAAESMVPVEENLQEQRLKSEQRAEQAFAEIKATAVKQAAAPKPKKQLPK